MGRDNWIVGREAAKDVVEGDDTVEDSSGFCTKGTHLSEGSSDQTVSFCEDAVRAGGNNPSVSATVLVSTVGHEEYGNVGKYIPNL